MDDIVVFDIDVWGREIPSNVRLRWRQKCIHKNIHKLDEAPEGAFLFLQYFENKGKWCRLQDSNS